MNLRVSIRCFSALLLSFDFAHYHFMIWMLRKTCIKISRTDKNLLSNLSYLCSRVEKRVFETSGKRCHSSGRYDSTRLRLRFSSSADLIHNVTNSTHSNSVGEDEWTHREKNITHTRNKERGREIRSPSLSFFSVLWHWIWTKRECERNSERMKPARGCAHTKLGGKM